MAQIATHWVAVAWPEWGHCRSLLTLCARLTALDTTRRITFLTHSCMAKKAADEVKQLSAEQGTNLTDRLVVIGLDPMANSKARLYGPYHSWYEGHQLLEAVALVAWPCLHPLHANRGSLTAFSTTRQLRCPTTGLTHDFTDLPAPSVILNDMFAAPVAQHLRMLEKESEKEGDLSIVKPATVRVKIFMWFSTDASRFLHHVDEHDHIGTAKWATSNFAELDPNLEALERYTNMTARFGQPQGKVVKTPGLPDMYDYEFSPASFLAPGILFESLAGTRHQVHNLVDGCILASAESYQPQAVQAVRHIVETKLGKSVYFTGPPLPMAPATDAASAPAPTSVVQPRDPSLVFMDEAKQRFGAHSVVLISFGTCYFPSNQPEAVTQLLNTLLHADPQVPFCLSLASAHAKDGRTFWNAETEEKLQEAQRNGICYTSKWLPQRPLLFHEAMGVFVSHCGYNSACEAISACVPLVAWPLVGDQPGNAAFQSGVLGTAWEFFTVKNRQPLRAERKADRAPLSMAAEMEQVLLVESRPNHPSFLDKKAKAKALHSTLVVGDAGTQDLLRLNKIDRYERELKLNHNNNSLNIKSPLKIHSSSSSQQRQASPRRHAASPTILDTGFWEKRHHSGSLPHSVKSQ